ncbi:hypothetical protein [Paenibacillus ihbetae]|uniref:hypothetical protein n=1 Tax=Paenibacillus ihbetae TaxID=1870820 RepID=UPI0013001218|nr:hypothetical protein [Paenibacillus ihbetae]
MDPKAAAQIRGIKESAGQGNQGKCRSGESKKAQVRGIKESPADWISAGLFANVESFDVSLARRPIVPR